MRFLVAMLVLGIALAAAAQPIVAPGEHTYIDTAYVGPQQNIVLEYETEILETIQDGVDLAIWLTYEHTWAENSVIDALTDTAGNLTIITGIVDTVAIAEGTYADARQHDTPIGWRSAVVSIWNNITLVPDLDEHGEPVDVEIDFSEADYGILCCSIDGSALIDNSTLISNLTIIGGASRDSGLEDDGDGRLLTAGICCLNAASPVLRDIEIVDGATGIIARTQPGSDDSAPVIERVVIARGSHHGVYVFRNGFEPVIMDGCTLVENADHGIYVSGGNLEVTNSVISHSGKEGIYAYEATPTVRYCNVFYNDESDPDPVTGPLNYGGTLDDLTGIDGNISLEPFYCDFTGITGYNYHVCFDSPHIGAGEGGVTIGALGAQCSDCASPVEATSWGAIKALYAR
jgi:hypothetical protein